MKKSGSNSKYLVSALLSEGPPPSSDKKGKTKMIKRKIRKQEKQKTTRNI